MDANGEFVIEESEEEGEEDMEDFGREKKVAAVNPRSTKVFPFTN